MAETKTKKNTNGKKASVGSAIAPPTCTKVIPIYPVRYAVMPDSKPGYNYTSTNLKSDFPELADTSYCIRNLRDEGFVYVYDPKAKEKEQWSCYQYNYNAGSLWTTPGFYKLKINKNDGAVEPTGSKAVECISHCIHNNKPEKIYMAYVDSPLTKTIMKEVENGTLKNKIMQEIDVGTWLKTYEDELKKNKKLPEKTPPKFKNVINIKELTEWNKDYDKNSNMQWSENSATNKIVLANVKSKMLNLSKTGGMAVVLYDAVGIASELSQLVNFEVNKVKAHSESSARKEWVSTTIVNLTKSAGNRTYDSTKGFYQDRERLDQLGKNIIAAGGSINNNRSHKMLREKIRAVKLNEKGNTIATYDKAHHKKKRETFIANLPKQREEIDKQIKAAGKPHLTWIEYSNKDGCFSYALLAYDVKVKIGFHAYQRAITRSVDGLLVTKDGREFIAKLLPAEGPVGMFEKALKGHPDIISYLSKNKSANKEFNVIEKMVQLSKLSIQPTQASIHLSLIVTTALFQHKRFTDYKQFFESEYRLMLEIAEGNAVGKKEFNTEELPNLMMNAISPQTGSVSASTFKFSIKVSSHMAKTFTLYNLGESKNPYIHRFGLPKPDEVNKITTANNSNVTISGLATVLSALNIFLTLKDFKDEDKNVLVTSLSVANGILSGASATASTFEAVFSRRAALTKRVRVHFDASETRANFERIALRFAVAASLTSVVKGFFKAYNSDSTSQTVLYSGSLITHSAVAGQAFYKLMSKSNHAFGIRATATIGGVIGKGASRVLLGPQAALIMLGVEALAFALDKWADSQEKSKELRWIEQSIWGIKPNKQWDAKKEEYEISRLFMSPKVNYEYVRNVFSFKNGYENATITLPGFKPQVSHVEIIKGRKRQPGSRALTKTGIIPAPGYGTGIHDVVPTIIDTNGARIYKYEKVNPIGNYYVEYWPNKFADPNTVYRATSAWIKGKYGN